MVKHLKAMGERLVGVQKAQDKATAEYGKATDKLKTMQQHATSIAGAYQHDAFSTGGLAASELQFRADTNDARRVRKDLKIARHRGLSGALAQQLAASGNYQLLDELAHASPAEIKKYEAEYAARQRSTRGIGADATTKSREVDPGADPCGEALDRTIDHLDRRLARIEHDIERGARKGTHDGNRDQEHAARVHRRAPPMTAFVQLAFVAAPAATPTIALDLTAGRRTG